MKPQRRGRDLTFRFWIALILPLAALLLLAMRLWLLQVVRATELKAKAATLRTRSVALPAPRGIIVDRKGRVVAGVASQAVVSAAPSLVTEREVAFLSEILETPAQTIQEKLEDYKWRRYLPVPLFVGATQNQATKIAEAQFEMPGVDVDFRAMRAYADNVNLSHVLGYVWTPSAEDLKRLQSQGVKEPAEYVGKIGIEAVYETRLMGRPGVERLEVDNRGRPIRRMERENAQPGEKMTISIDADLQALANRQLEGRTGAVVALDPRNGEVLCLASGPTYDVSLFEGGISRADFQAVNNDPDKPLLNRAISGTYSPGSTFKMVTTLAGVKAGLFDPNRRAYCAGYYKVGNRKLKCLGTHGAVAYHEALVKSCNAYFADLAVRAGRDKLCEAALDCGLGVRTGIDLIGESKGTVPTDAWMASQRKGRQWYVGDTVNMAIGQGETATTPLQMVMAMSLVANRGVAYRPHIGRAFLSAQGELATIEPAVAHQIEADASVWDAMQSALVDVIERGTARGAQIPGVRWGGKTGSTEHRRTSKTHSWFVGFAPAENPRIAIAVLIERAGHGGEVAAPIAGTIVRRYLETN